MARFTFDACDDAGAAIRGVEMAIDEVDLDKKLKETGLLLVKATRVEPRRQRGSTTRELIDLCYHLSIVLEAGVPLLEGLQDLANSEHRLHETIRDVARKIESGSTFSSALDDYPDQFPELLRNLIAAGEESGALDRVLKDLVVYLEWRETLRRQITSAATYPIMIVFGICALGILLGVWVLPKFLEIFSELGASLPASTRALIWINDFVAAHWLLLIATAICLALGFGVALRHPNVRGHLDAIALRVPVLGNLILMIETSRFAHNLGLLISTGVPMLRSLDRVEQVIQNRVVQATVNRARERVSQGATLSQALGNSELFPSLVMRMISVGESSGHLEEALERVANFYDREIPVIVSRALAVFNTGVLLMLGATLVTVALSIFGPLYQMMGDLNG